MKLLATGDYHSGNVGGITPPGFMVDWAREVQEIFWGWWTANIAKYGPFDAHLILGDMTDGEGKKGTLDTTITNVGRQANAAAEVARSTGVPADHTYIVEGTPFHTNGVLEYERLVADELGCSCKAVQKLDIEGWKIHGRHVNGRSDIPYGQGTPLLKNMARLEAEAFRDDKDAPDIMLTGHVHYSTIVSKHGRWSISVPSLELPISEANGRRYSSWEYDVGFNVITLERDREPMIQTILMPMRLIKDEGYLCVSL